MEPKIPEINKKAGVCYAVTVDGVELPVIDITHPAFALTPPGEAEMSALIAKAVQDQEKHNRMPAWFRNVFLWLLSRKSLLMRGLRGAAGAFLSGMTTYLMKLGPGNLGSAYSGRIDQAIAASLPAFSTRLRLQDMARLLADGIAPALAVRTGQPLHFINIAGGPCMDSLNALILLQKKSPRLVSGRPIKIHVLDLEKSGPIFAGRALEALQAPGAPLQDLNITLDYIPYNWSEPQGLRDYLATVPLKNTISAVSSEGGLFNYGGSDEISGNLSVLHELTPADAVLAGTITPPEGPGQVFNQVSGAKTLPRTLEEFRKLIRPSGWVVKDSLEQPMNHVVGMRKA